MKPATRWWGAAVLWCALIFALSSIPDHRTGGAPLKETLSRKGAHLVEYGVLAFFVAQALMVAGRRRRTVVAGAFVFCALYAVSDEIHQAFVPGRYGQVRDVVLDILGAALVLSVYHRRRPTSEAP